MKQFITDLCHWIYVVASVIVKINVPLIYVYVYDASISHMCEILCFVSFTVSTRVIEIIVSVDGRTDELCKLLMRQIFCIVGYSEYWTCLLYTSDAADE